MLELRADGDTPGIVSGVAVNYGEVSKPLDRSGIRERIERGAFGPLTGPIFANLGHRRHLLLGSFPDGGLVFQDTPEALRFTLDLPPTSAGRDAAELVQRRILQAVSIEFLRDKTRAEGRVLIVRRGRLFGLALVDRPAYPGAEIKEIQKRWREGAKPGPERRRWCL